MSRDLDPVNTKPEKIKKATMIETTDHFIFVLEENSGKELHDNLNWGQTMENMLK